MSELSAGSTLDVYFVTGLPNSHVISGPAFVDSPQNSTWKSVLALVHGHHVWFVKGIFNGRDLI